MKFSASLRGVAAALPIVKWPFRVAEDRVGHGAAGVDADHDGIVHATSCSYGPTMERLGRAGAAIHMTSIMGG